MRTVPKRGYLLAAEAQPAPRQVVVDLVPGLDHDLQATALPCHLHDAVAARRHRLVMVVQQGHRGDARREVIGVVAEAQRHRIGLETTGADRHVHMRLGVDAAQAVAGMDARAAPHADALQPAFVVVQRLPARIERLAAGRAADPHVDVLQPVHRQALGLSPQAPGRDRAADLAVGDGQHGLADIATHIEAAVQVVPFGGS